jgi:hypothetical protein
MSDFIDYSVPMSRCPSCGAAMDGAAPLGHTDAPEEGSLSICSYCGGAAQYAADLSLQPITDPQAIEFVKNDPGVQRIRAHIAALGPYRTPTERREK